MELVKPDAGVARSSVENAGKDLVLAPADHAMVNPLSMLLIQETDFGSSSVGEEEHGGDGRITVLLDVFDKGGPPPTFCFFFFEQMDAHLQPFVIHVLGNCSFGSYKKEELITNQIRIL